MSKIILLSSLLSLLFMTSYAQIAEKAEDVSPLLIGETIPNETIYNAKNEPIQIDKILKEKPTVLVFYRGGWCPYCNLHLAALGEAEADILKLGYQIIAISPENYQNIQPTVEKDKINYKVFSDPKANLTQKMGLAFKTNQKTLDYLSTKTKGEVSEALPVPAVMVVNTDGEILFEYINPNYKKRLTSALLLAVLQNLEK